MFKTEILHRNYDRFLTVNEYMVKRLQGAKIAKAYSSVHVAFMSLIFILG
jgi:hypothetical protein